MADWHHQVYVCPYTLASDIKDVQDTRYLCHDAVTSDATLRFYLRGLVPLSWITADPADEEPAVKKWGAFESHGPGSYGYFPR